MIDYEKLRLAHQLACKCAEQREHTFVVQVAIGCDGNVNYMLKAYLIDKQYINIDDLINKLQELTAPKPKYEVGQEVYYLYQLKPTFLPLEISEINPIREDGRVNYRTGNGIVFEEDIYPSEDALIDAQIDYWKKLKMQSISESNG